MYFTFIRSSTWNVSFSGITRQAPALVRDADHLAVHARLHAVVAAQLLQAVDHGGVGKQRVADAGDAEQPAVGPHELDLGRRGEQLRARNHRMEAPPEREQIDGDAAPTASSRERPRGESAPRRAARSAAATERAHGQRRRAPGQRPAEETVRATGSGHVPSRETSEPAISATVASEGDERRRQPHASPSTSGAGSGRRRQTPPSTTADAIVTSPNRVSTHHAGARHEHQQLHEPGRAVHQQRGNDGARRKEARAPRVDAAPRSRPPRAPTPRCPDRASAR